MSCSSQKYHVTYIDTPSRFFVRKEGQTLAAVTDQLRHAEENWINLKTIQPTAGDLVLAPSPDDVSVYRAKVVAASSEHEELGRHYKCHFFDEGHTRWVPENFLRGLPDELRRFPPLAKECRLHKAVSSAEDGTWSDRACVAFYRLIESHDWKLTVVKRSENVRHVDFKIVVQGVPLNVAGMLRRMDHAENIRS